MSIEILPETPYQHADAIEALYDAAFGPGHFAKTAERLREGAASLAAINRVAITTDGAVVGVCRVWPILIEVGGTALFIGPVAVAPSHRGSRLGLAVTQAALQAATEAGWVGALLIGAPTYFGEIGFRGVPRGTFILPGPQDPDRIMVCDLAGCAQHFRGQVRAMHRVDATCPPSRLPTNRVTVD